MPFSCLAISISKSWGNSNSSLLSSKCTKGTYVPWSITWPLLTVFRDTGEFHVVQLGSILTNTFKGLPPYPRRLSQANSRVAYASKDFPGQMESTQLSKLLCDQGIKLRIRKETRCAIPPTAHSIDEQ